MAPAHVEYVRQFVKLSLWYVHQAASTEQLPLPDLINQRVDIYRLTDLFHNGKHPAHGHDDPQWNALLDQLERVYRDHHGNSAAFEQAGLNLLWPHLELKAKSRQPRPTPASRPFECWLYRIHLEYTDRIDLHINNAYAPQSPLSERWPDFARSLLRLVRHVQQEHPQITTVACGSWLNDVPPFQKLFPPVWLESAQTVQPLDYTQGHWGQFKTRGGEFHVRNAAYFRDNGRPPFRQLRCRCRIGDLHDWLVHLAP